MRVPRCCGASRGAELAAAGQAGSSAGFASGTVDLGVPRQGNKASPDPPGNADGSSQKRSSVVVGRRGLASFTGRTLGLPMNPVQLIVLIYAIARTDSLFLICQLPET